MGEGLATLANLGRISHPSKEPRFLSTTTARNASAHHEWRSIPQQGIEVTPMAFSWRASWLHVLGRVFATFDGLVDPASTPSFLLATCLYARVLARVDVSLPRVRRGGLLGRSERFQDVFRHVIHVQFLQRREGTFHVQEGEQRLSLPFHAHFEASFPRFVWIDHHAHVFSRTFQQLLELVGPRLERTSGSTRFHDHGDVRVCGTAFAFRVFLASFHDVSLLLRRSCGGRRRGLALGRHADVTTYPTREKKLTGGAAGSSRVQMRPWRELVEQCIWRCRWTCVAVWMEGRLHIAKGEGEEAVEVEGKVCEWHGWKETVDGSGMGDDPTMGGKHVQLQAQPVGETSPLKQQRIRKRIQQSRVQGRARFETVHTQNQRIHRREIRHGQHEERKLSAPISIAKRIAASAQKPEAVHSRDGDAEKIQLTWIAKAGRVLRQQGIHLGAA